MTHADRDKRRSVRLPFQAEVDFSDGSRFFSEHIVNISTGGILIEASRCCEPGTELVLILPFVPPRKVRGVVRWCTKKGRVYQVGIQFVDLTPEQESSIRQCMSGLFWSSADSRFC
ncbi:MAG: PilZ domain-containing protein [Deltaproteobacteria bacterium]